MSEKKIAEAINVRINVGNYQHIDITKYAETTITYENEDEMVKKEDELTQQLLSNVVRNMRTIPERLGKKTDAVDTFEDSVTKIIPEWLANGPIPNMAENGAKQTANKINAETNAEVTQVKAETDIIEEITSSTTTAADDLSELVPADGSTKQPEEAPKAKGDTEDIFGDDNDLFE